MARSEQRLHVLMEGMVRELERLGIRYSYITCDGCPRRHTCPYAYDPYNIDGDCLAEK